MHSGAAAVPAILQASAARNVPGAHVIVAQLEHSLIPSLL
jgi:hypothetical protein